MKKAELVLLIFTTCFAINAKTVSVTAFGADSTGTHSSDSSIQAAINAVVNGTVVFPPGAYKIDKTIDVTSSPSLDRSGISFVGPGGRRAQVIILGNTGGWMFDLAGTAWTYWKGLNLVTNETCPKRSTGGFLMAGTVKKSECLNNTFDNIYVDLYNPSFSGAYGTIGYGVIGSEENTWQACQTYANTPFIFSTLYSTISSSYSSVYKTIQADHSCGMNTFSGENSLVTYDNLFSNIYLRSANTVDFGNMYFGNKNYKKNPGNNQACIKVLGGTVEGLNGRFKIESKSTLLDCSNSELYNVTFKAAFGGGTNAGYPVMQFPSPVLRVKDKFLNISLDVSYYSPTDSAFLTKKIIAGTGVSGANGNQIPDIANFHVRVNQDAAQHGYPFFPSLFCGVGVNCRMEFADCTYLLNRQKHILQLSAQQNLGLGNGSGKTIGKVYLSTGTSNGSARAINIRVSGLISSINESGGGKEENVANCYFNVAKGAYSTNTGAIPVAANGASADLVPNIAAIAVSSDSTLYRYTGITLNMKYDARTRCIDLIASPRGSGTSLKNVSAMADNVEIEMMTSGCIQELIGLYLP